MATACNVGRGLEITYLCKPSCGEVSFRNNFFFFYHLAPPELEVPEEYDYTAAHSNMTSVLGWHCQTPREEAGDSTDTTGLSVYKHCCPLLALKQIKPEEIGSGWLHSV